jgi:hypothetical protein
MRISVPIKWMVRLASDQANMPVDKVAPNFISDLFFLLNAYQHFGLVKTIGNRSTAERNLSDIEKELKRAEASRGDWQGVGSIALRRSLADDRIRPWRRKAKLK